MITVHNVTKSFRTLIAVKDVSFERGRDTITGFLGPNGAGKSTMMRLLATYLEPDAGTLTVDGLDVVREPLAVRRRIGYLPGDTPLYQDMRADRLLAFVGQAHGLTGSPLNDRLEYVIDACELKEALLKRVKQCSTGYRKRLGLAAALLHDPAVLLLDEPTHGLDPLQVRKFRDLIVSLRPGRAILLSSHVVAEVQRLSDSVLILHDGRLLGDGTIPALCQAEGVAEDDLESLFVRCIQRERNEVHAHV